jgi:hypothetical protein
VKTIGIVAGCPLGGKRSRDPAYDYNGHPMMNQIGRKDRQSIVLTLYPKVFHSKVLSLDITSFTQSPAEGRHAVGLLRPAVEIADYRQRLLRAAR